MNISLDGKWVFADGIKLSILSWGDYPGLCGTQYNHKGPYKRKESLSQSKRYEGRGREVGKDAMLLEDGSKTL